MTIQQLSIFVENRPGKIAAITRIIAEAGIDIRALSVADTQDFGILRLIVNDTPRAVETLRHCGYIVSATEMAAVCLPDEPGSLAKMLGLLAENNVDLEYMYAFFTHKRDCTYMALRAEDTAGLLAILDKGGYPPVAKEDIYQSAD